MNQIRLSPDLAFVNNNIMNQLIEVMNRVSYLTYMVDSFIESSGPDMVEKVDKLVCKKTYFDDLSAKDNAQTLESSQFMQDRINNKRARIVERYGELFALDIEFEYQQRKEGGPGWGKKNLVTI